MKKISRRTFMAGVAAASAAVILTPVKKAEAAVREDSWALLIDLTKCNGCKDRPVPACVDSCHKVNQSRFPEPDPAMLKPYWPMKTFEDYSTKRDMINRFTPYNWTFVQNLTVEHDGQMVDVSVPRRCMHCDNPPCAKLCPFGVNQKDTDGPVHIDPSLCFGGAKCRTVCPWGVPQRQAGVGVYTYLDPVPVGGGVMFKCDFCRSDLKKGETPACISTCPTQAMTLGKRKEIYARAEELAKSIGGYIYGKDENGGTSTLYVSKVPFESMDKAIVASLEKIQDEEKKEKATQSTPRLHKPDNMLDRHKGLANLAIAAPIVGAVGAFAATVAKREKNDD